MPAPVSSSAFAPSFVLVNFSHTQTPIPSLSVVTAFNVAFSTCSSSHSDWLSPSSSDWLLNCEASDSSGESSRTSATRPSVRSRRFLSNLVFFLCLTLFFSLERYFCWSPLRWRLSRCFQPACLPSRERERVDCDQLLDERRGITPVR